MDKVQVHRPLPSMKSLVAFEATMRLGSMTAAAKELGTTQPAISQQIRSLEEVIGGSLLNRSAGTLIPNEAGIDFYGRVSKHLAGIASAVEQVQINLSQEHPSVLITANFGFTHMWLLPRMEQLSQCFPNLRIQIAAKDGHDPSLDQDSDIEITFGQLNTRLDTEILLAKERVFAVCSPAYAERFQLSESLTHEQLSRLTLLHMDASNPRWLDWNRWSILGGQGGLLSESGFKFNNYPLLLNATIEGKGVALGWDVLVEQHISSGQLIRLGPVVSREDHGYLLRTRHKNNAVIAPVVNWIREQVSC